MVGWLKKLWRLLLHDKPFPENCIKGIATDDGVTENGRVSGHVFYFKIEQLRNDGFIEQSINWEDDSNARDFTLKQKKGGKIQWRRGIAILPRKAIERLNQQPTYKGLLSYERNTLGQNIYHGNILLKGKIEKPAIRAMGGNLATHVTKVIDQKYK